MDPATETQTVVQAGIIDYLATFMSDGGIFMWVILGVWAYAFSLALVRFKALSKFDVDGPSFMNQIRKFILDNEVHHAINLCSQSGSLLAKVLKNGLKRANQTRQQIQDIIEATIIEANATAEKGLGYIALFANISTLLGLLGTIAGLIQSFEAVAGADPSEKAKLLAEGISKAMNTTAFGLVSAISLLVLHSYLSNRAQKIETEIDEYSMKLVDILGTKKTQEYQESDKAA